jgi:hypothetical protein
MKVSLTDEAIEEASKHYSEIQRGYAVSLHYNRKQDAFVLTMRAGSKVVIPRIMIEEFRDVKSSELEKIVLDDTGGAICYEPFDMHISVPGLVSEVTGVAGWIPNADSSKPMAKPKPTRTRPGKHSEAVQAV